MKPNHCFSPADMAAHRPTAKPKPKPKPAPRPQAAAASAPRQLTAAEEAIAPGVLSTDERFKPTYHRGLLMSGMHPEARLTGLALLWFAHHKTGSIRPTDQPSRQELVDSTGLSTDRVGVQIEVLRERGWLHLNPITEGPRLGLPRFDLTIPALYLERVRAYRSSYQRAHFTN